MEACGGMGGGDGEAVCRRIWQKGGKRERASVWLRWIRCTSKLARLCVCAVLCVRAAFVRAARVSSGSRFRND